MECTNELYRLGGGYCEGIITKRIPRVILPWGIASVIYAIYWFVDGGIDRVLQICNNHENGYLIITNSWYVIAIFVFYIIFYISFRHCKDDYKTGIKYSLLGVVIYIIIAYLMRLGGWWIYSSFSFVMGMLWNEKENIIRKHTTNKYIIFLIFWTGLFTIGYAVRFLNSITFHSSIIYIFALLISSTAFAGIIFSVLYKVCINNFVWKFIGKISYEIYLLHELIYNMLRNNEFGLYIQSDLLYVIFTLFISVVCAYIFNSLITKKLILRFIK